MTPKVGRFLFLVLPLWGAVQAQAFSALRDPMRKVFDQFPEADGYRSIIRPVDKSVRGKVQARLPFKIHFNELGNHAVYAALRGRVPLGMIHARSEEGRWGLTEIAWSLTLDLKIRGFQFIRCRSRHRSALQRSAFSTVLTGRGVAELESLLTDKGRLSPKAGAVPPGSEKLALTVLQSAIKTLILTEAAWSHDIDRLREIELGLHGFPDGVAIRRLVAGDTPVAGDSKQPTASPEFEFRSLRAVRVRTGKNLPLGVVAETVIQSRTLANGNPVTVRWTFQADGRVLRLDTAASGWTPGIRKAFEELEGHRFAAAPVSSPVSSGITEKIAHELTASIRDMQGFDR